jgi:hypothetical protein
MTTTVQRAPRIDPEIEQYRSLMEVPSTFEEGFNWKSLFGALFLGILMVPGAIYMGLLAGQGIGEAAQWVTVILFVEVARRAQQALKKAEIYILFYMAGMVIGASPFSGFLWHQYYKHSQAAQASGIAQQLPPWYAPHESSTSYTQRTFLHADWLPAIGLVAFQTICGNLASMILGYGLFRLASDVEKLPFPMAPMGAQGILTLSEDTGERSQEEGAGMTRWRVFSIGGAIGLLFGILYLLVPQLTGALTNTPIQLWTIPFSDQTAKTQELLPAVATGLSFDLGNVIIGMVIPFFSVLGSFLGVVCTFIANPILYKHGVLQWWQPGDNTIITLFKNHIDFYFSFGIGVSLAVAAVGIFQVIRSVMEKSRQNTATGDKPKFTEVSVPEGRGDIKVWVIVATYFLITTSYIVVSMLLIQDPNAPMGGLFSTRLGVFLVLVFFGFLYTPLISYVTARLNGMVGAVVEIPMIKEASFIFSGYRGVAIWFLPIPNANYGQMTTFYRTAELTGTKFTSIWKTQVVLYPIIFLCSFIFMNLIWHMGEIPSAVYPFANKMWPLNAMNVGVYYSSTMGEYSTFQQAFKPILLGIGFVLGIGIFGTLNALSLPIFLFYGFVSGLHGMIHVVLPQFIGACIGRFYFQKRLGQQWLTFVPVLAAGYFVGSGLVAVLGIGLIFINKAIVQLPF